MSVTPVVVYKVSYKDEQYIEMLKCSIDSILLHTPTAEIIIFVVGDKKIEGLPLNIKQIIITGNFNIDLPKRKYNRFGKKIEDRLGDNISYIKLFFPQLLPNYDKILYVDCDVLCLKDITPIFEQDVKFFKACSILNLNIEIYNIIKILHGIDPADNYFGTGLLLMNLKKLRNSNFTKIFFSRKNINAYFKFNEFINSRKTCWNHCESILNFFYRKYIESFSDDVQCIFIDNMVHDNYRYIKNNLGNFTFFHFPGPDKSHFFKCKDSLMN